MGCNLQLNPSKAEVIQFTATGRGHDRVVDVA